LLFVIWICGSRTSFSDLRCNWRGAT